MDLSLRILEYMRKVRVIVNKHVSSDHFLSPEIKGVVAEEVPTTGAGERGKRLLVLQMDQLRVPAREIDPFTENTLPHKWISMRIT